MLDDTPPPRVFFNMKTCLVSRSLTSLEQMRHCGAWRLEA
jgi:hypothetical protein